jgi:hypothetical protein
MWLFGLVSSREISKWAASPFRGQFILPFSEKYVCCPVSRQGQGRDLRVALSNGAATRILNPNRKPWRQRVGDPIGAILPTPGGEKL